MGNAHHVTQNKNGFNFIVNFIGGQLGGQQTGGISVLSKPIMMVVFQRIIIRT